jgi:hypothetical protein
MVGLERTVVPLLIIFAPSWGWIIFANVLLGVNQGLCWSTTVIMKIDLVGPKQRGLAMGFNEFAGYPAVSLAALGSGYLAAAYGLRPAPFLPGLALAYRACFFPSSLCVRHGRLPTWRRSSAWPRKQGTGIHPLLSKYCC